MDYPSMSLGDGEVYFSFDVLDTTPDGVDDNGLVVVRFSLSEIAIGGTINFRSTAAADSANAWGSGVSQDTGNEVFWAGHVDNGTLRVFSWRNDSTTYFWRDVEVLNWPNGIPSSSGPNSTTGSAVALIRSASTGFPNNAVIGITRRLNELWLGWTASSGKGAPSGFDFPHPHVQILKLNTGDWTVIEQMQVWNPDHAPIKSPHYRESRHFEQEQFGGAAFVEGVGYHPHPDPSFEVPDYGQLDIIGTTVVFIVAGSITEPPPPFGQVWGHAGIKPEMTLNTKSNKERRLYAISYVASNAPTARSDGASLAAS